MPARDARTRIIDSAMAVIAKRGYTAATTRLIAEHAEVNEVTLFRHFGNKYGLLQAIGERIAQAPRPEKLPVDVPDLREALRAVARAEIETISANGACALRLAFDAAADPDVARAISSDAGPAGHARRLAEFFATQQASGRIHPDLEPDVLAEGFTALTSSFLMIRLMMGIQQAEDTGERLDALVDLFCDGALVKEQR